MPDTTINELPASIPSNAAAIPFSQGGTTYQVSPSSILQGAGPVFISGPGPGTRSYNTDSNPALEVQNSRYGGWPGTSFLNAASASNLMIGNTETGTKLMFGQYSTAYSWIQNRNLITNGNQVLMLQPEGGTVGIGLKSLPASTLHVNGTITATALQVPGCTLQVVQSVKGDTQLIAGASYVDVSGLSVSIQPRSAANKILVCASVYGGNSAYLGYVRLRRNDTDICMPSGAGARTNAACTAVIGSYDANPIYSISCANVTFLDSPNTTDFVTYKIRACAYDAASYTRINSSYANRDTPNYDPVTVSTITLMEIAG